MNINELLISVTKRIAKRLPIETSNKWHADVSNILKKHEVQPFLQKIWVKFAIFLLIDSSQCNSEHSKCEFVAGKLKKEFNSEKVNWRDTPSYQDYINETYVAFAAPHVTPSRVACAAAAYISASILAINNTELVAGCVYNYDNPALATEAAASVQCEHLDDRDSVSAVKYKITQKAYIKQSEKLLELLTNI